MLLYCGVGEDFWRSLGLQGDTTSHPKGNQSQIFIRRTEAEVEYFGYLLWRTDLFEKTLMLGKIEGGRRRGWQRMRWWHGITKSMDISLAMFRVLVIDREAWHAAVHGVTKSHTLLSNWTDLNWSDEKGFPWWISGKELAYQSKRQWFDL